MCVGVREIARTILVGGPPRVEWVCRRRLWRSLIDDTVFGIQTSAHVTDAGAERKEGQTKRKRKISVDSGRLARTTC